MTTSEQVDTRDMVLVHRVFRRELHLLPSMVRAAAGDRARAGRVAAHATEVLSFLHHHHQGEDALVWPRLRERAAVDVALVDRMESQHEGVAAATAEVEGLLPDWSDSADAATGERLAAAVETLRTELVEHLEEEETHVLPLISRHLSQREWAELGERGFASIPPRRRLATLGRIPEEADADETTAFLRQVPAPARLAYRLVGRRAYAKEAAGLRLPQQR